MAKTIKFNLICDNEPVRTIEDLQNNFSIEDMLTYYENGLLLRWLDVRGYAEEYDQVSKITSTDPIEIIKNLIAVFRMESDEAKIAESVYILRYLKEKKELCAIYEKQNYQRQALIDDYETGYRELIAGILENPCDAAKIKAGISEIVRNYPYLLELNHRNLFYVFMQKSQLALMCLMMNEQARKYYLPVITIDETGVEIKDINSNADKEAMYVALCQLIATTNFRNNLEGYIISFSGKTEGYWKNLEVKEKKYMIISMQEGDGVRSAGKTGGDLAYKDIYGQFVILDGIDYESNNDKHQLLYMEV